jgi:SPP1 gp7 family putative phage head morphogenesis protein
MARPETKPRARKVNTQRLTRAQRLALAPKPSPRAATAFLALADNIVARYRAQILSGLRGPVQDLVKAKAKEQEDRDRAQGRLDGVFEDTLFARLAELGSKFMDSIPPSVLEKALGPIARALYANHRDSLSRVLGIELEDTQAEFVAQFTEQNVGLIRGLVERQQLRLERLVTRAVLSGSRVESLSQDLEDSFAMPRARARLIARDQVLKANGNLSEEFQTQAGITQYIWSTSRDERVRGKPGGTWAKSHSDHWALEGTVQSWASPPVTNPETGARNHPGQDYQCRCVAVPVTDLILGV